MAGETLKDRIIEESHILEPKYSPTQIRVQSSNQNAMLESAYALLQGLYPFHTGPTTKINANPPIALSQATKEFAASLGDYALPHGVQVVPVHAVEVGNDYMFHARENCKKLQAGIVMIQQSTEYTDYEKSQVLVLKELGNLLSVSVTRLEVAVELRDVLVAETELGHDVPIDR
jgi:hypothetical protein